MSDKKFIDQLNNVLAWELAGIIQYLHHGVMVTGPERETFAEFFAEGSEEAHSHARLVADRITALGGIPTVEPQRIRPATDLTGMLNATLELEVDALAAWEKAHDVAVETGATKGHIFWLEEHIAEEQGHVDEMRKLTQKVSFSANQLPKKSKKKSS